MKLALIRRHFSATGGAELYLRRLMSALAGRGFELHLFTESWESTPEIARVRTIQPRGLRAQRPVHFAEGVEAALAQEKFGCVFSLERTLRQDVYRAGDGVHRVWLERRRQFAPWWKKPFIGFGGFHRRMLALEKQTFDSARTGRIIVNSEMVHREILTHFKFPEERLHLVRNGVDVDRFRSGDRAAARKRWDLTPDDFVLLFAGSGWERKGLRYVLEALPRNPPFKLLVAGKGRPPTNSPANAVYVGILPDLESAFAAADLFVFPPIYEPSANVVIEALAAGLPVITSAYNGASELIREGVNGSVVANPSDITSIHTAIQAWHERRHQPRPVPDLATLSLERNVEETIGVLELAARERRA